MTVIYGYTDKSAGRAFLASDDLAQNVGATSRVEKVVCFDQRFVVGTFGEQTLDNFLGTVTYHYLIEQSFPPMGTIIDDIARTLAVYGPKIFAIASGQPNFAAYQRQFVGQGGQPQGCGMLFLDVQQLDLYRIDFGCVFPSPNIYTQPVVTPLADRQLAHSGLGVTPPNAASLTAQLTSDPQHLMTTLVARSKARFQNDVGNLGTWAEVYGGKLTVHSIHPAPKDRLP